MISSKNSFSCVNRDDILNFLSALVAQEYLGRQHKLEIMKLKIEKLKKIEIIILEFENWDFISLDFKILIMKN